MWVSQRVGPFKAGQKIRFPDFTDSTDYVQTYNKKYVRIGIQAPQSPYITEVDNPTENRAFKDNMNRFELDINIGNSMVINENEILEFGDLSAAEYIKVTPLQDMDAYTIIEIQLLEEEEVSD